MDFTPELIQTILQIGGTPALVFVVIWRMWNGTSKRIHEIADDAKESRERLIKLEAMCGNFECGHSRSQLMISGHRSPLPTTEERESP